MSESNNWKPKTSVGWEAFYKLELLKLQHQRAEKEKKSKEKGNPDGLQE